MLFNFNRALYGYIGTTNDLEVVSTGKGIENLVDELDSCKILYAFLRVVDPKSGLFKFVLINWQGEGAALTRKGVCANHVKDVHGFFRGAHVTINARTEEEVEPEVILERVAKASATHINLKDRSDIIENTGPVGSNYQRVQPAKEINSSERESFWSRQQEEERKRKIEDRKRLEQERQHAEEEERKRELKEAQEREVVVAKKEEEIAKRREKEKNAENRARDILESRKYPSSNGQHVVEHDDPDEERGKRAEELRKARAEEAKTLISGSRIKDARALFEKNSTGPVGPPPAIAKKSVNVTSRAFNGNIRVAYSAPAAKKAPESNAQHKESNGVSQSVATTTSHVLNARKMFEQSSSPASNGTAKPVTTTNPSKAKVEIPKPDVVPVSQGKVVSPVVRSPSPQQVIEEEDEEEEPRPQEPEPQEDPFEEEEDDYIVHEEVEQPVRRLSSYELPEHTLEDIQEEPEELAEEEGATSPISAEQNHKGEIRARALYDYQAADETEISFDPDDIITHIDMIDSGWWQGMAPDGSYGLFPANYVEILKD